MKRQIVCLVATLAVLLSGCNWMDGNYHYVQKHEEHGQTLDSGEVSASNYAELVNALGDMVAMGKEKGVIYIGDFNQTIVSQSVAAAVRRTLNETPLGAYAVEDIRYEIGTNNAKPAVAVEISYLHGRSEIRQIRQAQNMTQATQLIYEALRNCDAGLVLQVDEYEQTDFGQLAEDYATTYPEYVMEIPQVTAGIYPENGRVRILEIKFTYQNSRDVLRQMQAQVSSMFEAAAVYVSGDSSDHVKLSRLYGFITGLGFDFQTDTSLTPAYSLLRHGVGDSKAFAVVYAAMCRSVGIECSIVTGTRNGEVRYWNIVRDSQRYCHVDILQCEEIGEFCERSDDEMSGYVWDYSAYPACEPLSVKEPVAIPAQ